MNILSCIAAIIVCCVTHLYALFVMQLFISRHDRSGAVAQRRGFVAFAARNNDE